MQFQYFSKNGKLLPTSEAVVSVFNIEYAYGFGVYENIRVQDRHPYFLSDHVDRLLYSALSVGLNHTLSKGDIARAITELVSAISENGLLSSPLEGEVSRARDGGVKAKTANTYNLKILLIGAKNPADAELLILPLAPLFPNKKCYTQGAGALAVNHVRLFPTAKTLNMLPSYYFYTQAKAKGYYDVLFMDAENNILEGSRTNFFAIKNKTIYTAPAEKVLEGVTKKYVLQVAREHGYSIVEQDISLTSIGEYDGAFLTSTSSKIVPLTSIVIPSEVPHSGADEESLSQSPITFPTITPTLKELMKLFDEFLDEYRKQKTTLA